MKLHILFFLFALGCSSDPRVPERHPRGILPTLSNCGPSATVVGDDIAMRVATRADHCSIAFATPFDRTPLFYATRELGTGVTFTYSVSATGVEIKGPAGTYELAAPRTIGEPRSDIGGSQ